jgi:hypothetical protein
MRPGDGGFQDGVAAMILKSEPYNFHRLDLTRQAGFIVTIYDEDGLRLTATPPLPTPAEAFGEARKIVDNRVEGPKKINFGRAADQMAPQPPPAPSSQIFATLKFHNADFDTCRHCGAGRGYPSSRHCQLIMPPHQ